MNRYAYTIFCDDIRYEVNNKCSFMGVFGQLMFVRDFPTVLPKLGVVVVANTPIESPFQSLTFQGHLGDQLLFDMSLNDEQIKEASTIGDKLENPKGFTAQAVFMLSPLHIPEPSQIKIKVLADGVELSCPGLQISKAPDDLVIV